MTSSTESSAGIARTAGDGAMADCIVVGASFAGLACATSLARAGMRVTILEKKSDPGEKLHTTGILVKEAAEQSSLLEGLPPALTRRIDAVRLYAPNMRPVDLAAPGYYFQATDTPNLMRWLAGRAEQVGVRIRYQEPFREARRVADGFDLGQAGAARYLVGADGPGSRVAAALGMGRNTDFLFGLEYEYADVELEDAGHLHCFLDRKIAPGYIGWVVAGVGVVQVGLARRVAGSYASINPAMASFLEKIAPRFDFRQRKPVAMRGGRIPCGGLVDPVAQERVLLVGDAAGMVSPVTAGGIHTALRHGWAAGEAIAGFLRGEREDPCGWFVRSYPRFRTKRALRFLFDHFQSDLVFNLFLHSKAMRTAASIIYFHRKGVLDPSAVDGTASERNRP